MANGPNQAEQIDHKNFFYPPGGILIWIIILLEVTMFIAGIIAFSIESSELPEVFRNSKQLLNVNIGLANTIILLTSGYFVAESVRHLKSGDLLKSKRLMWTACLFGFAFLLLKGIEFADKSAHGYDISHDAFFMFYWLLAGFHYIHVLIGFIILLFLSRSISKGRSNSSDYLDVETGASFWHMCDWIWLMLFPVLYLI